MHLVQWVVTSQARTEKWTQSNRAKPRNGEKWDQTLHVVAFNSHFFLWNYECKRNFKMNRKCSSFKETWLKRFSAFNTEKQIAYSRAWNKCTPTLINFLPFFQGLRPYFGLHRAYLSGLSIRYKWGYAYFFYQIFQGLHLFKGVRLFQTLE